MGTVSEVQHRPKITIWVKNKNNFDYYLAEESFLNCFTDVDVSYRCMHNDEFAKYDSLENNIYLIPVKDYEDFEGHLKGIDWDSSVFLCGKQIKIVFGCGHLTINKPLPESPVIFKVLCNDTNLDDDRIISINSYPVKLWNFYGSHYIQHRKLDVLKDIDQDIIIDDKEWWNTEEMEKAAITKITKKDHIWKALMIGQPFIFDGNHGYDLKSMGFKEYPWINKKVDKDFIRKNSYYINKHNKENFNKIVKENTNYSFFAKQVFTF